MIKKIQSQIKSKGHPECQAVSISITMFCFPTQQTFWKGCPRLLSPLLHYPSTPSSITFSSIISQNLLCQSCQWDHWPCKHSQGALVCLSSPWHSGPLSLPPLPRDHSSSFLLTLQTLLLLWIFSIKLPPPMDGPSLPFLPFFPPFLSFWSFILLLLLSLIHVLGTRGKDWSAKCWWLESSLYPQNKVRILWAPSSSIYPLFRGSHSFRSF